MIKKVITFLLISIVAMIPNCAMCDEAEGALYEYIPDFSETTVDDLEKAGWVFDSRSEEYKRPNQPTIDKNGYLTYPDTKGYGATAFYSGKTFTDNYYIELYMKRGYGGVGQYAAINFNYDAGVGGYQLRSSGTTRSGLFKISDTGADTRIVEFDTLPAGGTLSDLITNFTIRYNNGRIIITNKDTGDVLADYTDPNPPKGKHICLLNRNAPANFGNLKIYQYPYDCGSNMTVNFYDDTDSPISELIDGEITVKSKIVNNTSEEKNYLLYAVMYDSQGIISGEISEIELTTDAEFVISANSRESGERLVIYAFDSNGKYIGSAQIGAGTKPVIGDVDVAQTDDDIDIGNLTNVFNFDCNLNDSNQSAVVKLVSEDNNIVAIEEISLNESGESKGKFIVSEDTDSATYNLIITTQSGAQYEKRIDYINRFSALRALESIFKAQDSNALEDAFENTESMKNIQIDSTVFSMVENRSEILEAASACISKYSEDYENGILDEEAFSAELDRTLNIYSLFYKAKESTADELLNLFSELNDYYTNDKYTNIDSLNSYNDYYLLWDDEVKHTICEKFINDFPETANDFLNSFNKAIYLGGIKGLGYWGDVYELIKNNTDFFGAENNIVKSLKNKSVVYNKIKGSDFSSPEKLKIAENEYALKQREEEKESSGSTNISSPSGGGGRVKTGRTEYIADKPQDEKSESVHFNDIDNYGWASVAITVLADNKIIDGVGNGNFAPGEFVTREQFVKMINNVFDIKIQGQDTPFTDVPDDDWSSGYISAAQKLGLVNGVGNGKFGYGNLLSREEMVTMCVNYALKFDMPLTPSNDIPNYEFADASDISDYALTSVTQMFNAGLINGVGDNMFKPKEACTRAEAAKLLYSLYVLR